MARAVYKYPIVVGRTEHHLPKGAKFLCVQCQWENPQMWWEVDPNELASERHVFYVVGTGHFIGEQEKLEYRGTFQLQGGAFVGHLYEETS